MPWIYLLVKISLRMKIESFPIAHESTIRQDKVLVLGNNVCNTGTRGGKLPVTWSIIPYYSCHALRIDGGGEKKKKRKESKKEKELKFSSNYDAIVSLCLAINIIEDREGVSVLCYHGMGWEERRESRRGDG